jgi:HSP20 family molecular chaperone IbpA
MLAGIDEKQIKIVFQGDYLVLSVAASGKEDDSNPRIEQSFRSRAIDRQEYRVSADKYTQEQAKAIFKNGILTVTVPSKEPEGKGIEISNEGQ